MDGAGLDCLIMNEPDFDVLVIGGGVIGLAIAAAAAERGREVVLVERHESFGRETSSRNSEVVHAGLYYPPGTLKTRLCVEGRRELYRLAAERGVPFRKCGKLIVAVSDAEVPGLEALKRRGEENSVAGLRLLSAEEVRQHEPHVTVAAGLLSPESGIIDTHRLMATFKHAAESAGAETVFNCEVTGLERSGDSWGVRYRDAAEEGGISARAVVNAAGLGAQDVMRMAGLEPEKMNLKLHLCKGSYFSVGGGKRGMVSALVYPSPEKYLAGLGIHTVVDMGGGLKLGPDAEYVKEIDYTVEAAGREVFARRVQAFLPFIKAADLEPDMSGIRPKLAGPGEPARDFHIAHEAVAGAPGFFNLAGIESPGITASPAIARLVADMMEDYLG